MPHWAVTFYCSIAALLLPWTVFLSINLPTHHLSYHWDVTWAGFDALMIGLLAVNAYLAARKSIWLSLTASALGTTLIIDAWFDVLTARPGTQRFQSLLLALLLELPIAGLSWLLAYRTTHHLARYHRS